MQKHGAMPSVRRVCHAFGASCGEEICPMGHVHEAPATHVKSQVVAQRVGFKLVRMQLPAGEALPVHKAPRDLAIIVTSGEGRVTVGARTFGVSAGSVVEIPPLVPHGVAADQDLEIVVVQAG
jgi:quercetin dioxygenase-like cupin family protein